MEFVADGDAAVEEEETARGLAKREIRYGAGYDTRSSGGGGHSVSEYVFASSSRCPRLARSWLRGLDARFA